MNRSKLISELVKIFRLKWINNGWINTKAECQQYRWELEQKSDTGLLNEYEAEQ